MIATPRMMGPSPDILRLPRTWLLSSAMEDGSALASRDMDRAFMAVAKAGADQERLLDPCAA